MCVMAEIYMANPETGRFERVSRKKMRGRIKTAGIRGARRNPTLMLNR